ncbi:MAG: hypothetical protein AAF092_10050 [Pseudomonadota bacterium]
MIFGKLILHPTRLQTSNDHYQLHGIRVVSVRRPFLSAGLLVGALLTGFALSFWDLLYDGERISLCIFIALAVLGGWCIGQLRLVSRELVNSPLGEAVYGTYRHLRRESTRIALAADAARSSSGTTQEDVR